MLDLLEFLIPTGAFSGPSKKEKREALSRSDRTKVYQEALRFLGVHLQAWKARAEVVAGNPKVKIEYSIVAITHPFRVIDPQTKKLTKFEVRVRESQSEQGENYGLQVSLHKKRGPWWIKASGDELRKVFAKN